MFIFIAEPSTSKANAYWDDRNSLTAMIKTENETYMIEVTKHINSGFALLYIDILRILCDYMLSLTGCTNTTLLCFSLHGVI